MKYCRFFSIAAGLTLPYFNTCAVDAGQFSVTPILIRNVQVPGLPPGTTLSTLNTGVINEGGDVAFTVGTNLYIGGLGGFRKYVSPATTMVGFGPVLNDAGDVALNTISGVAKFSANGSTTLYSNARLDGATFEPRWVLMNGAGTILSVSNRGIVAKATTLGWDTLLQTGTPLAGGSPLFAAVGAISPTLPSLRDNGDFAISTYATTAIGGSQIYGGVWRSNTETRQFTVLAQETKNLIPLPAGQTASIPIRMYADGNYPSSTLDASGRAVFMSLASADSSQTEYVDYWSSGQPSDAALLMSPFHSPIVNALPGLVPYNLAGTTFLTDPVANSRGDVVIPLNYWPNILTTIAVRIRNGVAKAIYPTRADGTLAASVNPLNSRPKCSLNENGQLLMLTSDGYFYASDVFDNLQRIDANTTSMLTASAVRSAGGQDGRARVMNSASQIVYGSSTFLNIARVGGTARLSPIAPVLGPAAENGFGLAQAFAVDPIVPNVIPVSGDTGYVALDTTHIGNDLTVYLDLEGTAAGMQLVINEIQSAAAGFGLTITPSDLAGFDYKLNYPASDLNDTHYFYWNIMNLPDVDLTRIAVVPEPGSIGIVGVLSAFFLPRKARRGRHDGSLAGRCGDGDGCN